MDASISSKFLEFTERLSSIDRTNVAQDNIPNIFIDANGVTWKNDVTDGDFEEARLWTAPEVFNKEWKPTKDNTRAADVWSLGLVIVYLCVPKMRPILNSNSKEQTELDIRENLMLVRNNHGERLAALLSRLLDMNPTLRPSFGEIKSMIENLE